MAKEEKKKKETILDLDVWDEAAEQMERNQKGSLPDSSTGKEPKNHENSDESVLDKIKNFFK